MTNSTKNDTAVSAPLAPTFTTGYKRDLEEARRRIQARKKRAGV